MRKLRRRYRRVGASQLLIAVTSLVIYFTTDQHPSLVILSILSSFVAYFYFGILIPTTYKCIVKYTYSRWDCTYGNILETIIFEYDERNVPLN